MWLGYLPKDADATVTPGGGTSGWTPGAVPFGAADGTLTEDPTNFFYDDSTKQLMMDDGAVGTPSYAFLGDANTGVYSPGADQWAVATAGAQRMSIDATGDVVITQGVFTTGSPTGLTWTGAAHTTLTASTEATDVLYDLSRTVQFAAGALTTQRAFRIEAPTYAFASASTITDAYTLYVDAGPTAGTNATITRSWVAGFAPDTDARMVVGRAVISAIGGTDTATFSHVDFATANSYAIYQNNLGDTVLNCATGRDVLFQVNATTTIATFDSNGLTIFSGSVWADAYRSLGGGQIAFFNSMATTGYFALAEMTAPAGAANAARLFAQDNGGGKTQLMVIFATGVAQQIAIEA